MKLRLAAEDTKTNEKQQSLFLPTYVRLLKRSAKGSGKRRLLRSVDMSSRGKRNR